MKYLLPFFLITVISCAQNKDSNKELTEAKSQMLESIKMIQERITMPDTVAHLGVSDGQGLQLKPYFFDKKKEKGLEGDLKKKINKLIDTIVFTQDFYLPKSQVYCKRFLSAINKEIGENYFTEDHNIPTITISKIHYENGKIEKTDIKLDGSYDAYAIIENSKPILKMEAILHYKIAKPKNIEISKKQKRYFIHNDSLIVQSFSKNSFSFYASENVYQQILGVEGLHKNGRFLNANGSSKFSVATDLEVEYLTKFMRLEQEAILQIDSNKITTMSGLKSFFNEHSIAELESVKPYLFIKYVFAANIEKINIKIEDTSIEPFQKKILLYNKYMLSHKRIGDLPVVSDENDYHGIIDLEGKWFVQPKDMYLEEVNGFYYRSGMQYFWLNRELRQLEEVDYGIYITNFPYDTPTYKNDFVIVSSNSSPTYFGVINARTKKTILPITYKSIKNVNGVYITENKKFKKGVYNASGNQLLKEIYSSIVIKDKKIKAEKTNDLGYSELFNLKGRRMK